MPRGSGCHKDDRVRMITTIPNTITYPVAELLLQVICMVSHCSGGLLDGYATELEDARVTGTGTVVPGGFQSNRNPYTVTSSLAPPLPSLCTTRHTCSSWTAAVSGSKASARHPSATVLQEDRLRGLMKVYWFWTTYALKPLTLPVVLERRT